MRYVAKRFFKGSLSHSSEPTTLEEALGYVERNVRSDADWARSVIHYVVEPMNRRLIGRDRRVGDRRAAERRASP